MSSENRCQPNSSVMPRPLRRALLGLVLAASFGFGCKAEPRPGTPAKASPGESAESTAGEATVIRFSDPGNAGVLAYVKREHILERELGKVGARIEWVPAAGAFSANFEAMNTGTINASGAAISPIVGALAHNLKFRVFTISDPGEIKQSGLIAPAGSAILRVEDLVGKRVAVNLAAHGDYILLRALEKHGVPADKVERVAIQPPDAAAAFATGKIDAWSTFGVFFTTAVRKGARVLALESELESDDVGVTSANVAQLQQNPRAFQVFLRVLQDVTREAHQHPEKFQNVFTNKGPSALSGENLDVAIEETRRLPVPRVPTVDDRRRISNVANLLFKNRSIDRNIRVDEIVFDIDAASAGKGIL
jgi:sulfonate transport system substrate-binding protein